MFKTLLFKRTAQKEQHNTQPASGKAADSLPLKVSLASFWRMLKPYWTSKDSFVSWVLLIVIISLTAASIWIATSINSWYKTFWDTIQNYDVAAFKHQILIFAGLASIHVVVTVYKAFLQSRLAINWRRWLTGKVMNEWLEKSTYYKLQLTDKNTDNPDQRIADDLSLFVNATIVLFLGTTTDLAMMVTFAVVLWDLSGSVDLTLWNGYVLHLPDGYLLYLALIYSVAGTLITFVLGKPLVKLNFRQQRYEADFRFSLIRVRENAESIALYKGENIENLTLRDRFLNVVKNYISLINCQKRLGFLTLGYAQLAVIFPILIAAPLYFAKIITMGSIMQINSAFGQVQSALSTLVANFSDWASWKAVIDRLALFFDGMERADNCECIKAQKEGLQFKVENLEVKTQNGEVLGKDISFSLNLGDSLLIRGPSGCGKSTLIRTIAGIWPFSSGKISEPASGEVLFLSQRPYLPQGTLREAAGYPKAPESQGLTEKYFKALNLDHLIPLLDKEDIWSHILSLGEQQRVAFVRALLLKPKLLFLDEASSALDERSENIAYSLLKEELKDSIIVSVGHRSSLIAKHDFSLSCDGDRWVFSRMEFIA